MFPFGYCTNIHAARTLDDIGRALREFAGPLRHELCSDDLMPVGLWFPNSVLEDLVDVGRVGAFGELLDGLGLAPTTFNGFPYGDFHQPVVKHQVYLPTWAEQSRLEYTCRLAEIMSQLPNPNRRGTISTLPLGWVGQPDSSGFREQCFRQLTEYARFAESLEMRTEFHVRLCIEAEPGCYLGCSREVREFFVELIDRASTAERGTLKRYLGVCHDVCHAAVMFEDQQAELSAFRDCGIEIGKVQVSSAVSARFDTCTDDIERETLRLELGRFSEPKYLHQTMIDAEYFFEDLPLALQRQEAKGEWRVHFHVPIFAQSLERGLGTTQSEILECLNIFSHYESPVDWEIETYAWHVLPDGHFTDGLSRVLLEEARWLRSVMNNFDLQASKPT